MTDGLCMSILQIQFADGTTNDLPLERSQPVSIGRHSTSDIQIDEDAVAILHCRISWNRRHWEVTAASAEGVEVNGTIVRHAPLTERDLIRVGSVDLRLLPASDTSSPRGSTPRGTGAASQPASDELTTSPADSITRDSGSPSPSRQTPSTGRNAPAEEIPLRPLTEEEIVYRLETDSAETQAAGTSQQGSPDRSGEFFHDEFSRATEPDSDRDDRGAPESFLGDNSPGQSSTAERPAAPRPTHTRQKDFRQDGTAADSSTRAAQPSENRHAGEAQSPRDAEYHTAAGDDSSPETDESPPDEKPRESLLNQARHSRRDRKPRPGERDALRSPLVLGLGGGVLALLLGAATLWFTIGRQASSQQYSTALEHLNSGQFAQAAKDFQQILDERPNGRFSQEARIGLGRARIGQKIGAAPADWAAGLEELESFIRQQRDLAGFDELKEQVEKFARDISAGAATAAGQRASRSLLETSTAAERLALQYAGEDSDTDGFLAEMANLRKKSLRLIRRHEGLQAALDAIQQANAKQKPLAALAARRDLLARWPDLESLPEVRRLLRKSLETEQGLVRRTEPAIAALTTEPAAPLTVSVLARHTRARTDEPADGTIVIATTRAACFGIDLITGTPVWRKPLGDSSVFFPREVTSVVPALLLYEAQAAELQLVRQTTGAILWRLPLTSRPRGAPLIHEGQIYLATTAGELLQIDLHAGTLTAQLSFSQPVIGPPALLEDGGHLLLPAEQELVYLLSLRPLEIRQVHLLGHQAGALTAPPVQMGRLVLLTANDRTDSSRLYAVRTPLPETNSLLEPFSMRIPGHVLDKPVLRGRQLFVASSGERISAFTVTDDPAAETLTPLAGYQPQSNRTTALHLLAGTDGQLWMAGTMLRRLQLEAEQIVTEGTTGSNGSTSQPLKLTSGQLLFGRRQGSSDAVLFSRVDAGSLTGRWRVVLGARPLLLHPGSRTAAATADAATPSPSAVGETHQSLALTEDGSIFRLESSPQPASVTFLTQPVTALPVGDRLLTPLVCAPLASGGFAAAAGNPEPVLWIANSSGRIERTVRLPSPVECPPAELSAGLVVPVSGLLRVLPGTDGPAVEDFLSPVRNDVVTRWKQLLATSDKELLAIDSQQTVQRLQFRQEPSPHLSRVTSVEIQDQIDVPAAAADGLLYLAVSSGELQVIDSTTLELRRMVQLPAGPRGPVYLDGNMVFVEVEGNRLCAFPTGDRAEGQPQKSTPLWTMPLPPGGLAGAPRVTAEAVWLALTSGTILVADRTNGAVRKTLFTGERLAGGVLEAAGQLLVSGDDGVVVHLGAADQPVGPVPQEETAP